MAIYPYQTEPLVDFSKPENILAYQQGLKTVETYLGKHYESSSAASAQNLACLYLGQPANYKE
jgi:hypothetical protein